MAIYFFCCMFTATNHFTRILQKYKRSPFNLNLFTTDQKATNWVLGHGHSISAMMDYLRSGDLQVSGDPRIILDKIFPNKPAVMMEETSHSVWVNSKALQAVGLDGPNPPNWIATKVV